MKAKDTSRFDPSTLRDLGGDKVFARGERYFRDGVVEILSIEPDRVLARVAGMEDYRTVVTGKGTTIGGACSCPAFDREGFCKHMVAVALAANAALSSGAAESGGTLAAIRDYLGTRDTDALIAMIMDVAERDPALFRKLEIAATASGTDDKSLQSKLRAALRNATRTRGFVDYSEAGGWAAGVDAALAIELADYAIERVEGAIENIDDSDGHCTLLLDRAQQIHLDACTAAKPEPIALARALFRRETEGEYDTFTHVAARYAEVLGEEGLAEYRRLAQEAWDKLPNRNGPRPGSAFGTTDYEFDGYRLSTILDFFAERDGDVEMRIALRAKTLTSPWAYLQLAEFCAAEGRPEEALRRAEEGLWMFEDGRPDERLVNFAVDLLLKANRKTDAEAHLWRAFDKAPSLELFGRLRDLGGKDATQRAIATLRDKLDKTAATRWTSPADLLVRVLMAEKLFDGAWEVVRNHGASRGIKQALARASELTHADEAITVYKERVEELARMGGNPAYEEAVALVVRMEPLQDAEAQAAYVAALKQRHGRKRNFMRLLG